MTAFPTPAPSSRSRSRRSASGLAILVTAVSVMLVAQMYGGVATAAPLASMRVGHLLASLTGQPSSAPTSSSSSSTPAASSSSPAASASSPVAPSSSSAALASNAPVAGPLSVVGNRIVDANGQTLVLRGLNRDGSEALWMSGGTRNETQAEVDAMRSWGANVVRIPVNQALWTHACPTQYDATYEPYIDQVVNWVTGDGMVALVDLHASTGSTCGPEGRHQAPDAGSVTFWKDAAAHYASNTLVMFELFNEPHVYQGTAPEWLHGQTALITDAVLTSPGHYTKTKYQPLGEQQLYDAVEGAGARNLVMIDADHYTSLPTAITTGYAVNDYNHNIIYAVHPYQCTAESQSSCISDPSKQQTNTLVLDRFQAVAATYPVFASEFGWPANTSAGATYLTNTYSYLDAQSPAWGSAAFAWDGGMTGTFNMLNALAPTWTPDTMGQAVYNELSAH